MLGKILQKYANLEPDVYGEALRSWAFTGEGLGCYSNFEVNPTCMAVQPTAREFRYLWGRDFIVGDINPDDWGYCDAEALKDVRWYVHHSGIEFGWHWDGDGILAFFVPELNVVFVNGDCKKRHNWTREYLG